MRLGFCTQLDNAPTVAAAGFDFIEVGVQQVLRGQEDDNTWEDAAPDPDKIALPLEVANSLLPASLRVVGPDRQVDQLKTYMRRVARRAARLGIHRLVFGSGGARNTQDRVTQDQATNQLVEFCRLAGDCCAKHDVTLVIEPLNRDETDTINSVAAGADLIARVDHPAVKLLVDSYHFGVEHEPIESLEQAASAVCHIHVAEPVGRSLPGTHGLPGNPGAFDFVGFFQPLRAADYDQRISIECRVNGSLDELLPPAVDYLKRAWSDAKKHPTP